MADKEPSIKQQRYLSNLVDMVENGSAIDNLNKKDAALNAGYSMAVATKPKQKIESRPSFQRLLNEVFPDSSMKELITDGTKATKTVTASFEGVITDEKVYADYPTRLKYIELVLKLKGELIGSLEHSRRLKEEGLPNNGDNNQPTSRVNILRQDIKFYLGQPNQGEIQRPF